MSNMNTNFEAPLKFWSKSSGARRSRSLISVCVCCFSKDVFVGKPHGHRFQSRPFGRTRLSPTRLDGLLAAASASVCLMTCGGLRRISAPGLITTYGQKRHHTAIQFCALAVGGREHADARRSSKSWHEPCICIFMRERLLKLTGRRVVITQIADLRWWQSIFGTELKALDFIYCNCRFSIL